MPRKILLIVFVTIFLDLLGFSIVLPILPVYASELGASAFAVGVITAAYSLMNFLFAPFWGTLSDRKGRRMVLLVSIAITAVGHVAFAFAGTLMLLFLARVLAGIGSANISTAQALATDISAPEDRSKALGLVGAAFGIGFIIGPPLGGLVKLHFGIEAVGLLAAGLSAFNLVLAGFLLPETAHNLDPSAPFRFTPISDIRRAFSSRVVSDLFGANFVYVTAFSLMTVSVVLLWEQYFGITEAQVGYLFAFVGLVQAIMQGVLIGPLTRRFGEYKLAVAGSLFMAAGLLMMPFIPKSVFWPLEFLPILCTGIAAGLLNPTLTALISLTAPQSEQGKMLGLNQSVASLARVVGPVLGGWLFGRAFFMPYVAGSVLMLVVWAMLARHPKGASDPKPVATG